MPVVFGLLGAALLVALFMPESAGNSGSSDPGSTDTGGTDTGGTDTGGTDTGGVTGTDPATGTSADSSSSDAEAEIPQDNPASVVPLTRSDSFDAFTTAYSTSPYYSDIQSAEEQYGLPSGLLARQLYSESKFNPNATNTNANGSVDEGIAQFNRLPNGGGTASDLGIDPFDPTQAIPAAAKYLKSLHDQTGDWQSALVAYNWGIGNVKRLGVDAAPAATQTYASNILADVGGG